MRGTGIVTQLDLGCGWMKCSVVCGWTHAGRVYCELVCLMWFVHEEFGVLWGLPAASIVMWEGN